jgi:hypothetical protein
MSARRRIAALLALSALAVGALMGVSIEGVTSCMFTEGQLTSLGEYLGGNEHYGRRTYLRTDPAKKAGLYLIVDFDTLISKLSPGTVVLVDYFRASDGQLVSLSLPMANAKGSMRKALYIGLTDLQVAEEKLLAWHISLVDKNGMILAERSSFLWKMPDKTDEKSGK